MTLTANQTALLTNLYLSQYQSGLGRDTVDVPIWRWDAVENVGKSAKSAGGVIMQAQKKGLVGTDGVQGDEGCVWMTEAGFEALLAHFGINAKLTDEDIHGWMQHHVNGADEPAVVTVSIKAEVAALGSLTKGGRARLDSAVQAALIAAGAGCEDTSDALTAVYTAVLRDDVLAAMSPRQHVWAKRMVRKGAKA